ncbi:MAG: hypothetical protein QNL68_11745 [Akkermansiaceae bacterium]|jgi:hypothetical protein
MTWNERFLELFRRCLTAYQGGNKDFNSYYTGDDLSFLASIGYKPRELFDFVEDLADEGVPAESTALLIAAVRRDYFLVIQGGQHSSKETTSADLPPRDAEIDGIAFLPRIIVKAEAKLRGELDPNLMFSCGGDRGFLARHGDIHPADFLRQVWAANGDAQKVADFLKASSH